MKVRVLAFLMLAASCAAPAFAEVRFGFDLGVSSSTLDYEDESAFAATWTKRHRRLAPTIGGVVEFALGERITITSGLRYVQHGIRVDVDDVFYRGFEITQHYLSAPALLSARPFPTRRVFVAAGPEVAVLLTAESKAIPLGAGPSGDGEDIKDDLDPANLSLDGQVGVELPLGHQVAVIGARYSHGMMGVARESRWVSDWSTRAVEILFGVRW